MTPQECQSITKAAIERGLLKFKAVTKLDPSIRAAKYAVRHLEHERNKRLKWLSQGLTSRGTPRKRTYQWLEGLTDGEKHQRQLEQQRSWRKLNYTRRTP